MRSLPISNSMRLRLGIVAGAFLAALSCLPAPARAQEAQGTPPPLQPAEQPAPRATPKPAPTPEPEPVTAAPSAAPMPTPRVHAPKATPPPADEPVAVVNGAPVYRPLFKSSVEDPVDRALILREYRRRGYVLPGSALEAALKNYTRTGFGDDTKLQAKLDSAGASSTDYRTFVAEEVKLQAMLSVVSKSGRTDTERKQLRDAWVAGLRKDATINKPAAGKSKKA